jgi:hypothetical protein
MADEQTTTTTTETAPPDYEAQARASGWRPQAEFKGEAGKWVDAKTWVENADRMLPLLRVSNRELKTQLEAVQARQAESDRMLRMANKALEELKADSHEAAVESLEAKKKELTEQIVAAHEAGDLRAELTLRDAYTDVTEEIREAKRKPAASTTTNGGAGPTLLPNEELMKQPDFKQFMEDNPYFGVPGNEFLSGAALGLMNELNMSGRGKDMTSAQKFQFVTSEMKKRFGQQDNFKRGGPTKVEGSRTESAGGSSGGGNARSYENLSADAKEQCNKLAKRFVGKVDGRGQVRYKTVADYQAQYAADYFAEDWGQQHLNA